MASKNKKGARRHHNNKGTQQVKSGNTARSLFWICQKLGMPYTGTKDKKK